MEQIKSDLRPLRRKFDKLHDEIEALLTAVPLKVDVIAAKFTLFSEVSDLVKEQYSLISAQLIADNATEKEIDEQDDLILSFREKAETLRMKKERLLLPPIVSNDISNVWSSSSSSSGSKSTKLKLPEIKIKKFNGEPERWLSFWTQFKKVDKDDELDPSDKLYYLLQYLEEGSDPYKMVELYPCEDEYYPLALAALKEQYGDNDMLLQFYIRGLLNIVISNASSTKKPPLKDLHVQIETHLRAIKSLELNKADPDSWIYPLVESGLPEEVQYAWHSSVASEPEKVKQDDGTNNDAAKETESKLTLLMKFIQKQVKISQKMGQSKSFIGDGNKTPVPSSGPRPNKPHKKGKPALSSFHNGEGSTQFQCVFCPKPRHRSKNCFTAQKMTYADKKEILSQKKLCYRCTGKHRSRECDLEESCSICGYKHYDVLCRDFKKPVDNNTSPLKRAKPDGKAITSSANVECTSAVALQTLMVRMKHAEKEKVIRAFIDQGSQRSYILTSTATTFELEPLWEEEVVHLLFGGNLPEVVKHQVYEVWVSSLDGQGEVLMELRDHKNLCGSIPRIGNAQLMGELKQRNIKLSDLSGKKEIELLIGADMYPLIVTGEHIALECGAAALNTRLGWTVLGKMGSSVQRRNLANMYLTMAATDAQYSQLWSLEAIGISDDIPSKGEEETEIIKTFKSKISRKADGRYCVALPWKASKTRLPSNRALTFTRLQNATEKLKKTGLYAEYDKILLDWEKEEFIERVEPTQEKVHYIPHRPVVKLDSLTTPVRPVFDASCKTGRFPSVNDLLFKGDNWITLIFVLFLRFREKLIAFISDLRKAFQMIGIDISDRDVMRFLCWKTAEMMETVDFRHMRVMFGATCSPYILGAVLHKHLTEVPEEIREMALKLLNAYYVDNCVSSEDSVQLYEEFRTFSIDIMKEAKMDLRGWMSNVDGFEDPKTHTVSVLGLEWDRKKDELFLKLTDITMPEKITRRTVLSAVHKIFDPIGFSCPVTLPVKVTLQQTWIQNLTWDEPMKEEEKRVFVKWMEELPNLNELRIPRLATDGVPGRKGWSLHIFNDASKDAYATVVYLRIEQKTKVTVQLLAAKCRLAPVKKEKSKRKIQIHGEGELKRLTIAKLELMGCFIGSKLASSVKDALNIEESIPEFYWTDSTTALAWIKRENMWGTFVGNRVETINTLTKKEQWHHVPGIYNPADFPSRGCFPLQLVQSKWWEGPDWLYQPQHEWPSEDFQENEEEINAERKKRDTLMMSMCLSGEVRYGHTYKSYVKIMGWVCRFYHNSHEKFKDYWRSGMTLTEDELVHAEYMLIYKLQQQAFSGENASRLKGLELFEDSYGILRVKTRLTYRNDDYDFKFPMILPGETREVQQLICDTHREKCHAGTGMMMMFLRERFWILQARKTIKSVIFHCHRCRRFAAKACVPVPAPLPNDRVKDAEVFEVVGVDLAGPLHLRDGSKVWLVKFTCAIYRAVHFELVESVSTYAFILALENFVRRYRRPAIIYSDNGTNFHGAANMFEKFDWEEIEQSYEVEQIKFKFIPAYSPWHGGWWERLIRTAKDLFKRTVGKETLDMKELEAVTYAIADVMNHRPLTYVSEDPADLEALTPADFLHPFGKVVFPEKDMTDAEKMRFRWKYVKTLQKELKQRFRKEYLAYLVNRNRKQATRCLKVGELVLIGGGNKKRLDWPLAKVIELLPGQDGEFRLARLQAEGKEMVCPFQLLYPLKMDTENDDRTDLQEKSYRTRGGRESKKPDWFKY